MSVRIGKQHSHPRYINGGSPQGSILGNYLFCMTTDWLGREDEGEVELGGPGTPAAVRRNMSRLQPEVSSRLVEPPGVERCGPGNPGDPVQADQSFDSIDTIDSDGEYDFRFFHFKDRMVFDSSDEDIEALQQDGIDHVVGQPAGWEERELRKCVYIDDYNVIEKVRQRDVIFHLTTAGRSTMAHAPKSQYLFNNIKRDAHAIGMKVNDQKTKMVCISPSSNTCKSYLLTNDGNRIESTDQLKLLGFMFNASPTPHAQIDHILTKFRHKDYGA